MALSQGDRVGPYEILAPIGAGGMGEVYRARDAKLNRDVAIKVLPAAFAADPERLARFEREARVLASLNHPNIAQIYGVEGRALVMELVDGVSPKGPMSFDDAWKIALQIASALEYAHDRGIVHRDLKPANIKITTDGVVKLLDFGLAKAFTDQKELSSNTEHSPTLTIGATESGVILGTAAYMAPEQAKGKSVDKRADIWAFGVVLYELLTGERLFKGDDAADTLAQVLTKEPKLDRVPVKAQRLLSRCLEKDPKQRLRDIGDAAPLIETPAIRAADRRVLPWALASVLAVAFAAISFVHFRERIPEGVPMRFEISMPENVSSTAAGVFSISPDGRKLVFSGSSREGMRLWVRPLDSLEAHPLAASVSANPEPVFWSPDSRSIAYWSDGKLRRVDLDSGLEQTICDWSTQARGGSWNGKGVILFGTNSGIMRVSAEGGTPVAVTRPALSEQDVDPSFLEDGSHFFYLRRSASLEKDGVYTGTLDAKPEEQSSKLTLATNSSATYVPGTNHRESHLLFLRQGSLFAQAIDSRTLALLGVPTAIAGQVGLGPTPFSASANGVLVYSTGGLGTVRQLTWFDRHGIVLGTSGEPGRFGTLKLSPDGMQAAIQQSSADRSNPDIWVMDLMSGTKTRLTFDPAGSSQPVWSPDGAQVAFQSRRSGFWGIYRKAANGARSEELIAKFDRQVQLTDWSRDGRYLVYFAPDPKTKEDVWVLPLEGDRKPFPAIRGEGNEIGGYMSPDDRFIAYRSDETGRNELFVQTFDPKTASGPGAPAGKWIVSKGSAGMARWRRDGKELLYISNQGEVMAVPISLSPVFRLGPPELLFRVPGTVFGATVNPGGIIDVTADNQKFLVEVPVVENSHAEFTVVVNWQAVLRQ